MKKNKKFLLMTVVIVAIILSGIMIYMCRGIRVSSGTLIIKNVSVNNETLQISGTTNSSGEAFAGYDYTIRNNNLYLIIRYSLVNPIHHTGDFNILIKYKSDKIKNIYLEGKKTSDEKLVWSANQTLINQQNNNVRW